MTQRKKYFDEYALVNCLFYEHLNVNKGEKQKKNQILLKRFTDRRSGASIKNIIIQINFSQKNRK